MANLSYSRRLSAAIFLLFQGENTASRAFAGGETGGGKVLGITGARQHRRRDVDALPDILDILFATI